MPCEILAELTLDDRALERSGLRLIEWAAACGASGVVIPDGPDMPEAVIRRLLAEAAGRGLPAYRCAEAPVGYTDKLPEPWGALNAALAGSPVVVKRLTLNRSLGGLAHLASLYPHEFAQLTALVRACEAFRTAEVNRPVGPTRRAADHHVADASVVAARPLREGDLLRPDDLKLVETLEGITAPLQERLIGSRLRFDRLPDEPITFGIIQPLAGRSQSAPLEISVVIRTKNEGEWLKRSLPALLHQQRPPAEIIIVDNASTDDTVEVAAAFGGTILSIRDDEFTFGRALNRGIARARHPWVVSLSAHCIPVHDRWLEAFAAERGGLFTAAVYGRQEPLPNTSDFDKRDLWTTFGEERRVQWGRDYFFHNANSMVRKDVWNRHPFDETLNGVEDRDWAKRVLADGHVIVYAPHASVHHHHGIHQGRNEDRARRVIKVIELIRQPEPAGATTP